MSCEHFYQERIFEGIEARESDVQELHPEDLLIMFWLLHRSSKYAQDKVPTEWIRANIG
jgi:hypothetical protein